VIEEFRPAVEFLEATYDQHKWSVPSLNPIAKANGWQVIGVTLNGNHVRGSNHTQPFVWIKDDDPGEVPDDYVHAPCWRCEGREPHYCRWCSKELPTHMQELECLDCWDKSLHQIALAVACRETL